MIRLFTLFCLIGAPASAADQVSAADAAPTSGEVLRLEQSMSSLAQRNAWAGVERQYQELVALGEPLSRPTLLLAATAAREQGDVLHHLVRLVDAQALEQTEETQRQIDDILQTFGRAQLHGPPGAELAIVQVPFRPDAAKAIRAAQDSLLTTGRFDGFLPAGDYTFGRATFVIRPGADPERVSLLGKRAANRDFALDNYNFSKKATLDGHRLGLNGVGMRSKFGVGVYVAALYLTVPTPQSQAAVRQDLPKRIIMEMVYERVTERTIADQFRKSMNAARGADKVQPEIESFAGFMESLNRGDRVVLEYVPGTGTRVLVKGKKKGIIEGKEFMWVLFSIFVGDDPVSKRMAEGLLGGA